MKKRYYKEIGGKTYYATPNEGIALINGHWVANPTEQMLINDGWQEVPAHIRTLEEAKIEKCAEIDSHAKMLSTFTLNETPVWFDANTRTSLQHRFDCEEASLKEDTSIWYNGRRFHLTIEDAKDVIAQAELYASQCFDKCESHKVAVNALDNIEDVDAYDEKAGYPEEPIIEKEEIPEPTPERTIVLDNSEINMNVGETVSLFSTVLPEGSDQGTHAEVDNPILNVLPIEVGEFSVTAENTGTCTVEITSKVYPDIHAECTVNVSK